MNISKSRSTLKNERGQTDESLVSERGKTDDSFAGHRKQTELETDRKIQDDRQGADSARILSRQTTDATTDRGRSGRNKLKKNRTASEKSSDQQLQMQRDRDDAAVLSERSLIDAALVHERQLNDVEGGKFLERERQETDRNLLRERKHTDAEALGASNQLTFELESHKATQATLTSRDEFFAIVSHDLKNPIGAILSYSELLLEDTPRTGDEAKKWTQVIKRNAETSLRLISDILDMERFAEGKLHMHFADCTVSALVEETVDIFLHVAAERKISLNYVSPFDERILNCDRDRIGQVLVNLIGNALKFTPAGGQISVETIWSQNELVIQVTDSGIGVPENQKARIFNRYTQLANRDRQGLGLGLYISAMLVEAHQGKIGVAAAAGGGSVFGFSIPLLRAGVIPNPRNR